MGGLPFIGGGRRKTKKPALFGAGFVVDERLNCVR
jgi:hypothetical protein